MKIVIDIPEEDYNELVRSGDKTINLGLYLDLGKAVKNGTPLPKGHGRLIDADEVKIKMGNLDGFGVIGRCIDEFPPIVEADQSESGDKK